MLGRPIYAGVLVWNKTQKTTRRGTKSQRKRPATEWLSRPAPQLAIVDPTLWHHVQTPRAATSTHYLRRMDGRLIGRSSGADVASPYLLSGLAECARCGGSLVAMTRPHGRQRVAFYGCSRYHKRGVHVCPNGLQIRQDALDRAVVEVLTGALEAGVIAEAVEWAVLELRAGQAGRGESAGRHHGRARHHCGPGAPAARRPGGRGRHGGGHPGPAP
jgi:hypothetical protein